MLAAVKTNVMMTPMIIPRMVSSARQSARAAPVTRPCLLSESFDRRDLAFCCHGPASFFAANDDTTEFRDFFVDRMKRALGEFLRGREVLLKISYVSLGAFDLICRQGAKDSLDRFDFRHAMAQHHYVVS